MRTKVILLSLTLVTILGIPVFAIETESQTNNVFIDVQFDGTDNQWCGADGEFRTIHIIPRLQKNDVDFEIAVFSKFVSMSDGVVGEGFTQSPQIAKMNAPTDINYNIVCYDNLEHSQNVPQRILIEKDGLDSNSVYFVKINEKNLGSLTMDLNYLNSDSRVESNSSFLIVTGADACNSYGSFRMVNINHKESDAKTNYEVDVSSLFFNKVSTTENGLNHNVFNIVGSGNISYNISDSAEKINLDNKITCKNIGDAEEKFELAINENGQGVLNLPPIRSQG